MKPRRLPKKIEVRRTRCASCVFVEDREGGIRLTPERDAEVRGAAVLGMNQLCHEDNDRTICKGGRDFTLQVWCRMGLIDAPTAAALNKAMREAGATTRTWRED